MRDIDESDAPFLALALSFPNDGIWSDDKHFKEQKLVRVWTTRDMLENLEYFKAD
jgi:predicted nucleic acid-binding protein